MCAAGDQHRGERGSQGHDNRLEPEDPREAQGAVAVCPGWRARRAGSRLGRRRLLFVSLKDDGLGCRRFDPGGSARRRLVPGPRLSLGDVHAAQSLAHRCVADDLGLAGRWREFAKTMMRHASLTTTQDPRSTACSSTAVCMHLGMADPDMTQALVVSEERTRACDGRGDRI